MMTDISKITLDNINDYEPKKKYSKNLSIDYRENQLLKFFNQNNTLSYKQIAECVYGDIYVSRAIIQRIIKNLRKKGYKIKTISGYGFQYDNTELLEELK